MTDYKYMAMVGDRPVHFGTPRQLDYTKTRDKHAKRAYLDAHPGFEKLNRQNTRLWLNPTFWERWILWNKKSKRESIRHLQRKLHIRILPLPNTPLDTPQTPPVLHVTQTTPAIQGGAKKTNQGRGGSGSGGTGRGDRNKSGQGNGGSNSGYSTTTKALLGTAAITTAALIAHAAKTKAVIPAVGRGGGGVVSSDGSDVALLTQVVTPVLHSRLIAHPRQIAHAPLRIGSGGSDGGSVGDDATGDYHTPTLSYKSDTSVADTPPLAAPDANNADTPPLAAPAPTTAPLVAPAPVEAFVVNVDGLQEEPQLLKHYGISGCAFRPALSCEDSTIKQDVAVISEQGATTRMLENIGKINFTDDNIKKFFIFPESNCYNLETTDSDIYYRECEQNHEKYTVMQMPKGKTLGEICDAPDSAALTFEIFCTKMIDLLENGITFLNKQHFIHNNIKPETVLYHDESFCLIDWFFAGFLRSNENITIYRFNEYPFQSDSNQPVAYKFMNDSIKYIINPGFWRTNTKDQSIQQIKTKIPSECPQELTELVNYAHPTNFDFNTWCHEQINQILDRYFNDETKIFDWDSYVNLLSKNSDVYGWLSVINYCCMIFDDKWGNYPQILIKLFLSKYMYDVDIFTRPYNTDEIIREFKRIITTTS